MCPDPMLKYSDLIRGGIICSLVSVYFNCKWQSSVI